MSPRSGKKDEQKDETLDETVLVRLTPTEKEVFAELAKRDSRSLSAWIRVACREKARALGTNV
jgi:hypothetical protein